MEKPRDIEIDKAIIQNCLGYFWRCKCCIHLGWTKLAFSKCSHYQNCKEFVYEKLKTHYARVLSREKPDEL